MKDELGGAISSSEVKPHSQHRVWFALDVILETNAREAVEYALMEAGACGTETVAEGDQLSTSTAYFDSPPGRTVVREAIFDALRIYDFSSTAVREMNFREVKDRDWLAEWKKGWQPVVVGRFIIAPPWSDVTENQEQILIRIEPGMAFGTGTHETTRLCLAAIEKHFYGKSFLDVGTGTGILAIAAAKTSPTARVEACDTDAEAVSIAIENARLNNVGDRINFRTGTIDRTTSSADLVCANLTANVIVPLLPQLLAATCGRLVLSGILLEQRQMLEQRLNELGITEFEVETDGEWIAIVA